MAFELKTKGVESDRYLQKILQSQNGEMDDDQLLTPYEPPAPPSHPENYDDEDSLLQPVDEGTTERKEDSFYSENSVGFTCVVCRKQFKYRKSFKNHMKTHRSMKVANPSKNQAPYDSRSPYETPALYSVPKIKESSPDSVASAPRGERTGEFTCNYCSKSFKYLKAYRNHRRTHELPKINNKMTLMMDTQRPQRRHPQVKEEERDSPDEEDFESYQPQERDSSPDLGEFVTDNFLRLPDQHSPRKSRASNNNVMPVLSATPSPEPSIEANSDDDEPQPKRSRGRPKKPQAGPSVEQKASNPETAPSRGRGRPKKHFNFSSKSTAPTYKKDDPHELLKGFREVDLSLVLKSKTGFDERSVSNPASSTARSRSRSSSVEIVQEYDVFGEPKLSAPARTTFPCDQHGCTRKFHLRANLKKHRREDHGLT